MLGCKGLNDVSCAISDISTFFFLSLPSLFIYKTNLTFFSQTIDSDDMKNAINSNLFCRLNRSIHADPYAQISIRLTTLYSTTWTTTWWNLITNLQWNDPRRRTAILATYLRRSFHHLNLKSIEWVDGRENDRYGGLKKKENSPSKITWFITRLRRTMRKQFPPISVPLSQWKNTWQIKSKEKAMKLL